MRLRALGLTTPCLSGNYVFVCLASGGFGPQALTTDFSGSYLYQVIGDPKFPDRVRPLFQRSEA